MARTIVKNVDVSAADNSSDKWIATANCHLHDFQQQLHSVIQSQVIVGFPLTATAIKAALVTQIIADALAAGFTVTSADIVFPDIGLVPLGL